MFYEILQGGRVIDVLTQVTFCKYQKKHDLNLICPIEEGQAILSSDGKKAYHVEGLGLYNYPKDPTIYELKEISDREYEILKIKLGK